LFASTWRCYSDDELDFSDRGQCAAADGNCDPCLGMWSRGSGRSATPCCFSGRVPCSSFRRLLLRCRGNPTRPAQLHGDLPADCPAS
jgi:hypothetical protein